MSAELQYMFLTIQQFQLPHTCSTPRYGFHAERGMTRGFRRAYQLQMHHEALDSYGHLELRLPDTNREWNERFVIQVRSCSQMC